jgi:hypothetical protein
MLFRLPPPLLKLVDSCNTKNLKPKEEFVKKQLVKNGFLKDTKNSIKIESLDDLPRFYKISFQKVYFFGVIKLQKEIYCDWRVKFCFETKPKLLKN